MELNRKIHNQEVKYTKKEVLAKIRDIKSTSRETYIKRIEAKKLISALKEKYNDIDTRYLIKIGVLPKFESLSKERKEFLLDMPDDEYDKQVSSIIDNIGKLKYNFPIMCSSDVRKLTKEEFEISQKQIDLINDRIRLGDVITMHLIKHDEYDIDKLIYTLLKEFTQFNEDEIVEIYNFILEDFDEDDYEEFDDEDNEEDEYANFFENIEVDETFIMDPRTGIFLDNPKSETEEDITISEIKEHEDELHNEATYKLNEDLRQKHYDDEFAIIEFNMFSMALESNNVISDLLSNFVLDKDYIKENKDLFYHLNYLQNLCGITTNERKYWRNHIKDLRNIWKAAEVLQRTEYMKYDKNGTIVYDYSEIYENIDIIFNHIRNNLPKGKLTNSIMTVMYHNTAYFYKSFSKKYLDGKFSYSEEVLDTDERPIRSIWDIETNNIIIIDINGKEAQALKKYNVIAFDMLDKRGDYPSKEELKALADRFK